MLADLVLSNLYAREGRLPEALAEARSAFEAAPESAAAMGHLAHIEQMTGDLGTAEARLRKATQLTPHNDHLRRQLFHLSERTGKQTAA